MSSSEVIEEIKRLPVEEREKVIEFARNAIPGRLTPEELGQVAKRLSETTDQAEAERLKQQLIRGFYGNVPHA